MLVLLVGPKVPSLLLTSTSSMASIPIERLHTLHLRPASASAGSIHCVAVLNSSWTHYEYVVSDGM
jgi:hypothetical protein